MCEVVYSAFHCPALFTRGNLALFSGGLGDLVGYVYCYVHVSQRVYKVLSCVPSLSELENLALKRYSNSLCNTFLLDSQKVHVHILMRDEKEGGKKQVRSNKQQGKATQHTQGSQEK